MRRALDLALQGDAAGEVPVGAVVIGTSGELIGAAYNRPVSNCDPTAHAEILALREAATSVGNYRLPGCQVYVTIEPCTMCVGALVHSRVSRLVFGAREPKAGALLSHPVNAGQKLNHKFEMVEGVLSEECARVMQDFFARRRNA